MGLMHPSIPINWFAVFSVQVDLKLPYTGTDCNSSKLFEGCPLTQKVRVPPVKAEAVGSSPTRVLFSIMNENKNVV